MEFLDCSGKLIVVLSVFNFTDLSLYLEEAFLNIGCSFWGEVTWWLPLSNSHVPWVRLVQLALQSVPWLNSVICLCHISFGFQPQTLNSPDTSVLRSVCGIIGVYFKLTVIAK